MKVARFVLKIVALSLFTAAALRSTGDTASLRWYEK